MVVKGEVLPAFSRHIDSPVFNSRFDINEPQTSEQLTPVCSVCRAPAQIWTGRRSTAFITQDLLHSWRNLLEDTLMVLESSPSLLLTVQVTLRFTLGTTLILWVALP